LTLERHWGAGPPLISMRIKTAIIGVLLACLLAPAAAGAASTDEILRDCPDGQLEGDYSRKEIEKAGKNIPADLDEYSNCRGALAGARIDVTAGKGKGKDQAGSGSGAGSAGGGGTGSATPSNAGNTENPDPQTPAEAAAVKAATGRKGGGSPVRLDSGSAITPGRTGVTESDFRRSVPVPLLVVLILLGTIALVGGVLATRARVFTNRLG